jgi:signal transduction histidine kinase
VAGGDAMMRAWDRGAQSFFIGIVLMTCVAIIGAGFLILEQAKAVETAMLSHDRAVASALIRAEVPTSIIAQSLTSINVSDEGIQLISQMGQGEKVKQSTASYAAVLSDTGVYRWMPWAILWGGMMISGGLFFLERRERLYRSAAKQIKVFSEGDFSNHLQSDEEGGLYKMFAVIEDLATSLSAKSDAERDVKHFLKATLSDISHQLKTPLAALSMYNEIILDEPENVPAVVDFSRKTERALTRMSQLIQALLKIARLDAASVVFEIAHYSVRELVEQAVEPLMLRASQEGKQIVIDLPYDVSLSCDMVWTREAILNIVKNALDYSERGVVVSIACEKTAMAVRLIIADNGPGIAPESIYHIFKRFYRQPGVQLTQGVGLGLSLSKAIVEGQGGVITAQSTLGEGSAFVITFLTDL